MSHEFFPVPKRSSRAPPSDPWPILWGSRSLKRGCAVICKLDYDSPAWLSRRKEGSTYVVWMGDAEATTTLPTSEHEYLPETRKQGQGGVCSRSCRVHPVNDDGGSSAPEPCLRPLLSSCQYLSTLSIVRSAETSAVQLNAARSAGQSFCSRSLRLWSPAMC